MGENERRDWVEEGYKVLICDETEELGWLEEWFHEKGIPCMRVKVDIQIYKIMRMPVFFSHVCMKKEMYDRYFDSVEACIKTRGMLVVGDRFCEFYDGAEIMLSESDSSEILFQKLEKSCWLGNRRVQRKGKLLSLRENKEELDYEVLWKNPERMDPLRLKELLGRIRRREIAEAYQVAEAYLMECSQEIAFFLKKLIAKLDENDYNGACEICEKMMEIRLLHSIR